MNRIFEVTPLHKDPRSWTTELPDSPSLEPEPKRQLAIRSDTLAQKALCAPSNAKRGRQEMVDRLLPMAMSVYQLEHNGSHLLASRKQSQRRDPGRLVAHKHGKGRKVEKPDLDTKPTPDISEASKVIPR